MNEEINKKYKIATEVNRTAKILQEILIIIMAIAFTSAIVMFITDMTNTPKEFSKFTTGSIFAFICVITAIARFSHGNMSYLSRTYEISDYEAVARKYNIRLAVDFFFIFAQGVIFCGLSLYQTKTFEFYSLFATLFFVDAIWFFIIISFSKIIYKDFEARKAQEHMKALMNWMVANLLTGIIMVFILFVGISKENLNEKIPLFFIVIMLNTILDYGLNRKLYFPIGIEKPNRTSVFVAARFTTAFKSSTFDPLLKEKIEAIHEVIQGLGITLYSSHITEKFGKALEIPYDFVRRDISQISLCDIFVTLLDEDFSTGVYIELGWASFLGKKIIIFIPQGFDIDKTPMIRGLSALTRYCQLISYSDIDTLKANLKSELQAFVSR